MADLLDRMGTKFTVGDDCWLWHAAIDKAGYARIGNEGKVLYAHRVMYEMLIGPIPDGLQLDHLCRVRRCIRPHHLEPVTSRENSMRGVGVGPKNAAKTHCVNGHEFTPENTRMRYRPGCTERVCIACADIREAKRMRR